MKMTRYFTPLALFALFSLPATAEEHSMHNHDMHKPAAAAAAAATHHGTGVVKSINVQKGKAKIAHDPIASLQWPSMVMDFVITDPKALAKLQPGQKVEFDLVEKAENDYVISKISVKK